MRSLIIDRIKHYSKMDYAYTRGDCNAAHFPVYAYWLGNLCNSDLLAAYDRVQNETRLFSELLEATE